VNEDRSARYHRLKRRATVGAVVWSVLLLAGLLWTGGTLRLRDAAESMGGGSPMAAVALYIALLTVLHELGGLPISAYGFELERRYGLAAQGWNGWLLDQLKGLALGLTLSIGSGEIIYAIVRATASHWWWITGLVFTVLIVGLANLGPVLFIPLFYTVKPLQRGALEARLLALAAKAGARVLGVYEWGLGKETKKANAALAGIGGTRRILVSDTMLAEYSDDEIEVVLAHELAHHVHGDIWKGIAFESALMMGGFFLASRLLPAAVNAINLRGIDDIAGLPALLLVGGGLSVTLMPVAHALSRANERSADRFALTLTRNPGAFVSAMKRLGAQNLAEEQPSRLVQWLFYSHPPVAERIDAARRFQA
jgi:STE24 endopeptidase